MSKELDPPLSQGSLMTGEMLKVIRTRYDEACEEIAREPWRRREYGLAHDAIRDLLSHIAFLTAPTDSEIGELEALLEFNRMGPDSLELYWAKALSVIRRLLAKLRIAEGERDEAIIVRDENKRNWELAFHAAEQRGSALTLARTEIETARKERDEAQGSLLDTVKALAEKDRQERYTAFSKLPNPMQCARCCGCCEYVSTLRKAVEPGT